MFSRERHDEIVELLAVTAHYHRTGKRLKAGDTVNFGRPWLPGSQCSRGILSTPYLDGPKLEWLEVGNVRVRFLWLIPVTDSEVQFSRTNGLEALEFRFESGNFDYLDPARPSVA